MHRVIHSSTQAAAAAAARTATSRRFASTSRNTIWQTKTQQSPLQQQKQKSTLAIPPAQEQVRLTREQVSSLFWSAAIPMVGFGFMDNFIMITAGSAIDNSLGVHLGMATMTAAAIGQVVSDVSGVVFGDTLSKVFNVAPANLTKAQSKLKLVSRIKLTGGVLGVTAGCILGAAALWIIPDKEESPPTPVTIASTEEQQQQRTADQLFRLQQVMQDIMTDPDETWHDRRASCTLYVNESMANCLPSTTSSSSSSFFSKREAPASIEALGSNNKNKEVVHTLKEGRVVVFANTIYVPVQSDDIDDNDEKNIMGIVKIKLENGSFYNGSEIKDAKKVARNLGFFLNRMVVA